MRLIRGSIGLQIIISFMYLLNPPDERFDSAFVVLNNSIDKLHWLLHGIKH